MTSMNDLAKRLKALMSSWWPMKRVWARSAAAPNDRMATPFSATYRGSLRHSKLFGFPYLLEEEAGNTAG